MRAAALISLVALLPAALSACCTFGIGCTQWVQNNYSNASFDDVYTIAYNQIDRLYEMASGSDPSQGHIESAWDYDSLSMHSYLVQRERIVADVIPSDEGILFRLRVQCQTKERTGLLAPDSDTDEDWSDTLDDLDRARVVFQHIDGLLVKQGPSPGFYERPVRRFDGADDAPARK